MKSTIRAAAAMFVFGLGAALPLLGIGLASREALQRWARVSLPLAKS